MMLLEDFLTVTVSGPSSLLLGINVIQYLASSSMYLGPHYVVQKDPSISKVMGSYFKKPVVIL